VQEYTGHPWDQVLGMYYARARIYDAGDRRFGARDIIHGNVDNMLSANYYLYCLYNPVKYVDFTGFEPTVYLDSVAIGSAFVVYDSNGNPYVQIDKLLGLYGFKTSDKVHYSLTNRNSNNPYLYNRPVR